MFCTKCGAQIPDGTTFCPQCGAKLNAAPAPARQPAPAPAQAPAQAPQPAPQPAPAPKPKKKFTGNKVNMLLVIAMFISAATNIWVASIVLLVAIAVFVKDKWTIRNAVQPFAVGAVLTLCSWLVDLLDGTAVVTFTRGFGRVLHYILTYSLEAIWIACIVFLVIGFITLLTGETRIPIFSAFAKHFPDDAPEAKEKEKEKE